MTPEDRQMITSFFDRMRQLTGERDPQAEALIRELLERNPQTKYYITQLAVFQEHALAEAQNRIKQLEYQLQHQSQTRGSGGVFGSLFGGGNRHAPPPPMPVHAPGYHPGMFQQRGGGFLGTAVSTAAGVAGGMMLGSALSSMFASDPAAAAEAAPATPEASPWGAGPQAEPASYDSGGDSWGGDDSGGGDSWE